MDSFEGLIDVKIKNITYNATKGALVITTDDDKTYTTLIEYMCCEVAVFVNPYQRRSFTIDSVLTKVETDKTNIDYQEYRKYVNKWSDKNKIGKDDHKLETLRLLHDKWFDITENTSHDSIELRAIQLHFSGNESVHKLTYYLITASNGYYSPVLTLVQEPNE